MAESSLQDRLRGHAKAFDGLLSLIPAKTYYGEDNSDQWQKKKQTKQEAAAARRGKLDPDSELNRNAKEVMDERAKNKRKLREMQQQDEDDGVGQDANDDDDDDDEPQEAIDGVEAEKPGEGLRKKAVKKQKLEEDEDKGEVSASEEAQPKPSRKEEKRAAKRDRKIERKADKKAKREDDLASPATPGKAITTKEPAKTPASAKKSTGKKSNAQATLGKDHPSPHLHDTPERAVVGEGSANAAPTSNGTPAAQDGEGESSSSDAESDRHSPTFDTDEPAASTHGAAAEAASATTSVSSTAPPSEKAKHIKIPADTTALRARLAAKIEALRAARKADGPDGKPIRTRQELIEARRAKQAQRKTHKKELRRLAKIEESRKREEALASNSPGVMSPAVELDESTGNFSFGRVVFGDGSQMSHDLSYVRQQGKKKGPSDPKTALLKVQNQKKRLEELDADKRAEIADKEAWLTARRRLEGDKIRDDEAMLKKSVKRKEAAKKKSDKAWRERAQGVELAQKERQKKREDNLRKRRDEKLAGKAGKKKGGAKKKKGGRPGFEGSFGVGGRKK
ncbi:surfeit locus protein 6 domain-containing protein [Hirsutella rhossiliensis]|uniref:Surfeit locus protein 6 domain-containing protein n=1 Tax=Hirsutella rhossiliensis TaxID=111463 RepID=A0A9P8SCW9_9HYPO|nr:surfeit locus protein 6 domain-containing protein [Hirsutella rhossiliensis]KAH0958006.1 surfeit locus protein 6 domain-containing protein [Hirsutella rhossiliensis]